MFLGEDASFSAKRNEAYCGFSFTKTINWCRGTSRVARGVTHTRSCTLEHRNPNRAYISPRPSICRCVTEHRLIVLEIYISRTKLPLSNHSIENHPLASGFPALLQIATVATDYVGKRQGSPNESWSLASSTPKSAKLVDVPSRALAAPRFVIQIRRRYLSPRVNRIVYIVWVSHWFKSSCVIVWYLALMRKLKMEINEKLFLLSLSVALENGQ
jgi:hypothetical protein